MLGYWVVYFQVTKDVGKGWDLQLGDLLDTKEDEKKSWNLEYDIA